MPCELRSEGLATRLLLGGVAPAIGEASGESYKAAILSARSPTVGDRC